MLTALAIVAGLVAIAWTALAARALKLARQSAWLPPLEGAIPPDLPAVEAIVPARNEAAHIEATFADLLRQDYPNLRIIAVDDRSTDATGAILDRLAAGEERLRIVHGRERPAGWVGKTWAVQQGVESTAADWLWFVDADMGLHPRALAAAMAEARARDADLVTLAPRAICRGFWQGTIALAVTELLMQLFPIGRVNDPTRPEALGVGGFLLVRRPAYEQAGGHEAVRSEIIEDIALARRVKAAGGRIVARAAPGLAWTHFYGGFGEIWRGLRKNAYAGMDYRPHKYAVGAIVALGLAWAGPLALAVGLVVAVLGGGSAGLALLVIGMWACIAQAVAAAPPSVFLGLRAPFVLSLPMGITAYVAIATSSVWHHHRGWIVWKDVTYSTTVVQSAGRPGPGRAGDDPEVPTASAPKSAATGPTGAPPGGPGR